MKTAAGAHALCLILVSGFSEISSVAGQTNYSLARDYTYYPGNAVNPLVKKPLYYNDAGNVLADLDSFQSLYIQYHSCAWSMSSKYDREENVCEDDKWYIGSIPMPLPNVAYTLYGVKKGQATFLRRKPGCHSGSYINSFYTTAGFTIYTGSLYAAGAADFSSYASNNNDNNNGALSAKCGNGYGVACSTNHGFVYNQYSDDKVCDADHFVAEVDELADLNTKLESAGCFEIYNAGTASQYSISNNNNGNGGGNNKNDQNNQIHYPVQLLLMYSESCNLNDLAGVCPNPHGRLEQNDLQMNANTADSSASRDQRRLISSFVIFGAAAMVLLSTMVAMYHHARQDIAVRQKIQNKRRVARANKTWRRRRERDDCTVVSNVSDTDRSARSLVNLKTMTKIRSNRFFKNGFRRSRSNDKVELPRVDDEPYAASDTSGKHPRSRRTLRILPRRLNDEVELPPVKGAPNVASYAIKEYSNGERNDEEYVCSPTEPRTYVEDELTKSVGKDELGTSERGVVLTPDGSASLIDKPAETEILTSVQRLPDSGKPAEELPQSHLNDETLLIHSNSETQLNRVQDLKPVNLRSYRLMKYGDSHGAMGSDEEDLTAPAPRSEQLDRAVSGPPAVRRERVPEVSVPGADAALDWLARGSPEPQLPKAKNDSSRLAVIKILKITDSTMGENVEPPSSYSMPFAEDDTSSLDEKGLVDVVDDDAAKQPQRGSSFLDRFKRK